METVHKINIPTIFNLRLIIIVLTEKKFIDVVLSMFSCVILINMFLKHRKNVLL